MKTLDKLNVIEVYEESVIIFGDEIISSDELIEYLQKYNLEQKKLMKFEYAQVDNTVAIRVVI